MSENKTVGTLDYDEFKEKYEAEAKEKYKIPEDEWDDDDEFTAYHYYIMFCLENNFSPLGEGYIAGGGYPDVDGEAIFCYSELLIEILSEGNCIEKKSHEEVCRMKNTACQYLESWDKYLLKNDFILIIRSEEHHVSTIEEPSMDIYFFHKSFKDSTQYASDDVLNELLK